jgi:hypothetical protein
MKIKTYSTLVHIDHYAPKHEATLIESVFAQSSVETVSAVLTRVPDGWIGSTHLNPYRIH